MNKKKKSIPLITAGFVLLLVGVILFVFGISTNVPEMGGSGWFETSSRKTMFMFIGGALILFSSILLTVAFKGKINNSLSLTRTLQN